MNLQKVLYHGIFSFFTHFISYWSMVIIYDDKIILSSITASLKNQLSMTLPLSILLFNYYPVEYGNLLSSIAFLPFIIVMSDIYFYCTHRPLHTVLLWRYHKSHHCNTVVVSKSLDADILEHVISNLGSFVVGFLIFQHFGFIFNIYIYHMWVIVSTLSTCSSHSGKKIMGDIGVHHNHHKYLNCNYGTGFYVVDRIMGTYRE